MKTIYILKCGDEWLSYGSMETIGIFTSLAKAYRAIGKIYGRNWKNKFDENYPGSLQWFSKEDAFNEIIGLNIETATLNEII
ncbi:hypothetical protein [Campylobacter sp. MIT 97-5078]|uniref:hypothetical protein n=1 Tax=Campylobacter sp. MIT 97-5078 TaxID=1548153 RepID=UPI000514149E|nr:hypothetical protein [Campylobacter sp. MIT 97-5078]KGI55183.1 hypothetical protein LR59_13080 [Campylobacter sp. MIT 97-5078]TQR23053.1 hypothetical protein DMB91_08445 [Campylobacter sp. MIT 97-5078]